MVWNAEVHFEACMKIFCNRSFSLLTIILELKLNACIQYTFQLILACQRKDGKRSHPWSCVATSTSHGNRAIVTKTSAYSQPKLEGTLIRRLPLLGVGILNILRGHCHFGCHETIDYFEMIRYIELYSTLRQKIGLFSVPQEVENSFLIQLLGDKYSSSITVPTYLSRRRHAWSIWIGSWTTPGRKTRGRKPGVSGQKIWGIVMRFQSCMPLGQVGLARQCFNGVAVKFSPPRTKGESDNCRFSIATFVPLSTWQWRASLDWTQVPFQSEANKAQETSFLILCANA